MPLTVRPALPTDASVIVEFNRRLAAETENKILDVAILSKGVASVLNDATRGRYFVAEENGEVIGQTAITYEWSDWRNGWVWWLQSVYIRADARGRGTFREIFEYITTEAKRVGDVIAIRLYVERDNAPAQATYRRLGFEEMHFFLFHRGAD